MSWSDLKIVKIEINTTQTNVSELKLVFYYFTFCDLSVAAVWIYCQSLLYSRDVNKL